MSEYQWLITAFALVLILVSLSAAHARLGDITARLSAIDARLSALERKKGEEP